MRVRPVSWLDQAVGVCFSLLFAAAAVYVAVRLIEAVWTALLVIAGVGLAILAALAALAVLRRQRQRW